jgi:hypothetical protein
MTTSVHERLHREARAYSGQADRPLGGYIGAMALYGAAVAGITAVTRLTRRQLPAPTGWDLALTTAATHQLSRLIAKDPVTSPLRAPFTRFKGTQGPAELEEEVRGSGARKAIGEMVTCPFCLGLWVATAVTAGSVFAPRATRLATATLAALAGSDFLQYARTAAQKAAGEAS